MEKVRKDEVPFERSLSVGEYIYIVRLDALMHSLLKRLLRPLIF